MTKHDLKELAAMGAELGAAKAEIQTLRTALLAIDQRNDNPARFDQEIDKIVRAALSQQAEPTDTYTAVDMATAAAQGFRDGQAAVEPVPAQDEREAFDLFPDQLEALAERLKQYREAHKDDVYSPEEVLRQCQSWAVSDQYHGTGVGDSFQRAADVIEALLTRSAQAKQQPFAYADPSDLNRMEKHGQTCMTVWRDKQDCVSEPLFLRAAPIAQTAPTPWQEATGRAAFKNFHRRLCERFGYAHDEAYWWRDLISLEEHIAKQTAPQPEQSGLIKALEEIAAGEKTVWRGDHFEVENDMAIDYPGIAKAALDAYRAALSARGTSKFAIGDRVKKTSGSEWVGRVVGWYSTEQTKEGYAVESSAHRNSVQIYPAKALEAVE
ncbi:hypothetical protein ACQKC8_12555 [Stutzerimonas stutzeri]|uniref:hypothetical protein n=1 Tax=Stutzerimonas stutzeri TaxID=316 RepID=UPI003C2D9CAD